MLTLALALAATAAQVPDAKKETCPAKEAESLLWAPVRMKGVREEAERIAGKHPLRWITPGSAVQQDFVPERLNLEIGDDGWIHKVWCG